MNCPRCGQLVSDTDLSCPHCSVRLKSQGFWSKLLSIFTGSGREPRVRITKTVTVKNMNIVTNTGGERHVYKSLDEVPPEIRASVESALNEATHGNASKTFRVRDASGQEHTYRSLEEMPAHLRALVEKAQCDSKRNET
jgi:hypothetical protein